MGEIFAGVHFVGCIVQAEMLGRGLLVGNALSSSQFVNCGRGFAGVRNFSCVVTLFGGKDLIDNCECLSELKLS